jgi:hypothetical protein
VGETPWRFKSSHPHSQSGPLWCPISAQTTNRGSVTAALFTLLGVAVGVAATFMKDVFLDRRRERRVGRVAAGSSTSSCWRLGRILLAPSQGRWAKSRGRSTSQRRFGSPTRRLLLVPCRPSVGWLCPQSRSSLVELSNVEAVTITPQTKMVFQRQLTGVEEALDAIAPLVGFHRGIVGRARTWPTRRRDRRKRRAEPTAPVTDALVAAESQPDNADAAS